MRPGQALVLATALAGCQRRTSPAVPNIVLVSVDGLRADRVGIYGNPALPTPNLDRLADEGLRFQWAFSQANESLFSHASLFTGRHVPELAPPDYERFALPASAQLAGEVLGLYGYSTAAFVGGAHVASEYGFDQGFSIYDDSSDFGSFFEKTDAALRWIDQRAREPFFLVLHAYDCHRPYLRAGPWHHLFDADYQGQADELLALPHALDRMQGSTYYPDFPVESLKHGVGDALQDPASAGRLRAWAAEHEGQQLSQADIAHIRAHYDGGAFAADMQIGRFLEEIEQRGILDDTLVIVTADHGEDLLDHGMWEHRGLLADSTTRVPLVLWGAGLPAEARGTVRQDLAQAIDLLPTVLAVAGATPPAGLPGRDLLSSEEPGGPVVQVGVLPQVSARTPSHRLVFHGISPASRWWRLALALAPLSSDWFALYDLQADPGETRNAVLEQPERAEALRSALLRWHGELDLAGESSGPPAIDPALREVLRSRGYW